MSDALQEYFGNPSSPHKAGEKARKLVSESRKTIAEIISAPPSSVVFTSGGTEANNWGIEALSSMITKDRPHAVTSKIEHASVLQAFFRSKKRGLKVSFTAPDATGVVPLEAIKKEITDKTSFLSLQLVNNELGTVQPVKEVIDYCQNLGVLVHVDAAQAFGKLPINFADLGANALTISAHKVHGPKGVGALVVDSELRLDSLLVGGGQESGYRAGTENVAGIAGFAKAVELLSLETQEIERIRKMRDVFEQQVLQISGVTINGASATRVPHISNLSLRSIDIDSFITRCNASDICLSLGSACHTDNPDPSHVLLAIGCSESDAKNSVRVSLSRENTQDDVKNALSVFRKILSPTDSPGRFN